MTDQGREPTAARILIVEDEAILAEDLGLSLKNLGYVVRGKVSTGEEAVKLAEKLKPDLILMDIKLQGDIDGIEAADQIRKNLDIPVVYLTGYSESDVLERAKKTEPYGYIGKPISVSELRNTVETTLYRHAADKKVRESEEKYRLLFSKERDAIALTDAISQDFLDINESFEALYGYTREETIGMPATMVSAEPEDTEATLQAATRPEGIDVPLRWHKTKSGQIFPVEISANAFTLKGRQVVCSIIRDITERTKAEEALRKEKEKAERYLDVAGVIIVTLDSEGRVTLINRKGCELLGHPSDEIIGTQWFDTFVAESNREKTKAAFFQIMAGDIKTVEYFENPVLTRSGQERLIAWYNTMLTGEDGSIIGTLSSGEDITERKKAEAALGDSEEKYRTLVENLDVGVFITTLEGAFLYANPAIARIAGYESVEELMATPAHRLHLDGSTRGLFIQELLEQGRVTGVETLGRRKDGTVRWVSLNSVLQKDETGRVVSILNVAEDIAERKQVKEALVESEERLRLAMEATNDGVWDWDISTGETYYSPGYFLMLGLEPGQCTEHFTSWLDLIHLEDRQHAWTVNQDCVRGKRETFEVEFRMRHKDGSWRWILGRGKSIARNSEGTSIRLVGTHTDITERKQAEEAVRSARDELEQQVQDRTKELMATNQALRESQSTLRLITDSLPVLISYVDSDQRYRFCNKTYELWRGAPKGEIEGRRLREILGEDAYNEARPYVEAALLGSPVDYEMRATYRDGKEKHLHVIYVPDADEKGVTKGFAALIVDITERKKMEEALRNSRNELEERVAQRTADMVIANEELKREIGCRIKIEEALKESEEKYRLLHETMRDAFVSVDMRGRILETNRAYQDMLGYSEEELQKLTYVDLTPERWHAFEARIVEEQIIPKGFSDVYQKEYRRKDGTVFPVELRTFLIRDKAGNPSVMWAIVRDITERARAEKIIKASLTEKEVLLREIHHRVKNNLAVIQSLLRIQSHHVKNAELTRILEETLHRIRSMALGHELLYQSENLSDINISQYLDNLLHHLMASFSIMGKRIEIKQEIEEAHLSIDTSVPLGFILTELISNCYQHAFPELRHGEISVSLRCIGSEQLELVVKDDGIGLPEEMDVEKPKSLGYHLMRIFVKQLNGKIEIIRQKGTEVRIKFAGR